MEKLIRIGSESYVPPVIDWFTVLAHRPLSSKSTLLRTINVAKLIRPWYDNQTTSGILVRIAVVLIVFGGAAAKTEPRSCGFHSETNSRVNTIF